MSSGGKLTAEELTELFGPQEVERPTEAQIAKLREEIIEAEKPSSDPIRQKLDAMIRALTPGGTQHGGE